MAKAKKQKKALSPYNRHVQREMKAGRSMKQAADSWSKSSGKPKAASKSRSKPKARATGGKSRMGKRNGFNTQKIFKYLRMGALAMPAAQTIIGPGTPAQKLVVLKRDYMGVGTDGVWRPEYMAKGWMPFIGTSLVTYGIPKVMALIRGL